MTDVGENSLVLPIKLHEQALSSLPINEIFPFVNSHENLRLK